MKITASATIDGAITNRVRMRRRMPKAALGRRAPKKSLRAKRILLVLDDRLLEALGARAIAEGVTRSELVRRAIRALLASP